VAPHPSQQFPEPVAHTAQAHGCHSQPWLSVPAHPIPQVVAFPRPRHAALVPIQSQFQTVIQEPLDTGQHSFTSTRTTDINVRVIGIAHEAMASPFQLTVEFIEQDVRQQRRERAALRRPLLPMADNPARHDARFKVTADESEHALVFDMTFNTSHQDVVVDPVEEFLQVKFHAPTVTHRHMDAGHLDSLVSASARTKAVAVIREQRIEDRGELLQ